MAAAAAADARAALSCRSRVVTARGLVHAAQVAVLVVAALALLLQALAESPWAAAAATRIHRFAAFFLVPQRLCFLAVNIIVFLIKVFPGDAASLSPSSFADPSGGSPTPSSDSNGVALQQHPFLAFLEMEDPRLQAPPPITEAGPSSGSGEQAGPPPPPLEEEAPVFEDKQAVHVKTVRAQPPRRRTKSDKTTRGGGDAAAAGRTSAASPELRRAKSDNCKRRSAAAAAAASAATAAATPVELAKDDAEAFRQSVEAFIAKQQTWFHREESLILARASAANAANAADRRRCCGGREVSA